MSIGGWWCSRVLDGISPVAFVGGAVRPSDLFVDVLHAIGIKD